MGCLIIVHPDVVTNDGTDSAALVLDWQKVFWSPGRRVNEITRSSGDCNFVVNNKTYYFSYFHIDVNLFAFHVYFQQHPGV